jgi:hypothetical protein
MRIAIKMVESLLGLSIASLAQSFVKLKMRAWSPALDFLKFLTNSISQFVVMFPYSALI